MLLISQIISGMLKNNIVRVQYSLFMFNYITLEHTELLLVFGDHKIKTLRDCKTKDSPRI